MTSFIIFKYAIIIISLLRIIAIIVIKYAHQIPNKEITTPSQIYSILCPKTNAYSIARNPTWHRKVTVDLKGGRYIKNRDTITNLVGGDSTIILKGQ